MSDRQSVTATEAHFRLPAKQRDFALAVQHQGSPALKRPLDIFLAVIGLILSSPIWLVVVRSHPLQSRWLDPLQAATLGARR